MAKKDDAFLKSFDKCIDALNKLFQEDTYKDVETKQPELWKKLLTAEEKVNNHWGVSFPSFKEALVEYYKINLELIRLSM